jgi:hypothetical protein
LAQQGQPSNPGQATKSTLTFKEAKERWKEEKKPARPNVNIDTFGKPEMLTAAKAVCDDIPQYTGKAKFQTGAQYAPGGSNGALMILTYTVAEPKEQVKDWYSNALRMYGWNITFQSPTVLNATNSKSGNTIALQFCDEDKSKKGQSLLQIDYHRAYHSQ